MGAGNRGRLAGILSPVMRPLSTNIPGRRKQAIITVLGLNRCCSLPFTHCFRTWGGKSKTKTAAGHVFVSGLPQIFQDSNKKKKIRENEINLSAQHWSCGDYSWSPTLINPHVPLFALSQYARANYIQADSEAMHCRWSHDKWLYCPVMEIWIIIECLYSDVCTWYDSQWVFCQRTDELCCFYFNLPTRIYISPQIFLNQPQHFRSPWIFVQGLRLNKEKINQVDDF